MSRAGFTLIELLVVIGIIMLLISIAIPSLSAMLELNRQVTCGSGLASACKGIVLYTQCSNDKLPPYRSRWQFAKPAVSYMVAPENTYWLAKEGDLDPIRLTQRWRGIGSVYECGLIESPSLLYCPGQTSPAFMESTYNPQAGDRPFGSYSNMTRMVRTGYLWNAWGKWYSMGDLDDENWDMAFRSLSQMEHDKPLAMDHPILPWSVAAHVPAAQRTPSLNVACSDGHVESFTPSPVYLENLMLRWEGVLKNWADNEGEGNDWEECWSIMTGT